MNDCKTPYNRIPLCELERMGYVYIDIDGDLINELIIDCGDTLILRYYEGIVYLYSFTFRQLSHLYIDGSYSWNHTGENFEYGGSRIYFEGTELKTNELYRIVSEGESNAEYYEYYMECKPVTKEEFLKNINYGLELQLQFDPLEV